MTRLVMGNIGSTNLSIVVMKKTADLGDNRIKYSLAYETISKKTYVDNILIDAPDYNKLRRYIEEIKLVSAMGGFFYKEWTISGQDIPEQFISIQLPNQIGVDEERALIVSWDVKNDQFFFKSNLLSPGKRQKKTQF